MDSEKDIRETVIKYSGTLYKGHRMTGKASTALSVIWFYKIMICKRKGRTDDDSEQADTAVRSEILEEPHESSEAQTALDTAKEVTIGDNVVKGAESVVTKDIADWCIAAGSPCRVIRKITDEDKRKLFRDEGIDEEGWQDIVEQMEF